MQVFRSGFGRAITVIVAIPLTAAMAGLWLVEGFWSFSISLPAASFVVWLVAALYWFPKVEVDEGGVRIANVVRTHYISWNAIELIDTKYALAITALGKKYTAWAAPAPGRHSAVFASKDQGAHLPETTYLAGTVRPGDLITSDSGAAAAHIRRLWEQRDQDGIASVSSSWNTTVVTVLVVLGVLTLIAL